MKLEIHSPARSIVTALSFLSDIPLKWRVIRFRPTLSARRWTPASAWRSRTRLKKCHCRRPDEITALREEYADVTGGTADKRWKEDTLREKIEAAKADG